MATWNSFDAVYTPTTIPIPDAELDQMLADVDHLRCYENDLHSAYIVALIAEIRRLRPSPVPLSAIPVDAQTRLQIAGFTPQEAAQQLMYLRVYAPQLPADLASLPHDQQYHKLIRAFGLDYIRAAAVLWLSPVEVVPHAK